MKLKLFFFRNLTLKVYDNLIVGKFRNVSLGFMLAITLIFIFYLPRLTFNYNMEAFLNDHDPDVQLYEQFKEVFENENDGLLIALKNNEGIFQHDFLQNIDALTRSFEQVPEITNVLSPTDFSDYVYAPLAGHIKIPVIHLDQPERYQQDEQRIYNSTSHFRSFFSNDRQSLILMLKFKKDLGHYQNQQLLGKIKKELNSFAFDHYYLGGRIETQNYYMNEMRREMLIFSMLSIILFTGALYYVFRNWKLVFVAMLVVLVSQIWIFGIIAILNVSIDLMMVMLPALIFILGTSISIHTITRFQSNFLHPSEKQQAIRDAVSETGIPNFLNAITTSAGFASLVFIPFRPIQQFGLFTSIGILISFFVAVYLIPVLLRSIKINTAIHRPRHSYSQEYTAKMISKGKFPLLAGFALIIAGGLYFTFKIEINNFFLDDLNEKSELKKDMMFFENNFSGIKPVEVFVYPKDSTVNINDREAISEIALIEDYLRKVYDTDFILSPATYFKTMNKALHGGSESAYKLPESKKQFEKMMRYADSRKLWNAGVHLLETDENYARISFRTHDRGSLDNARREARFNDFFNITDRKLEYKLTGVAHLLDNANKNITNNLMKGIFMAVFFATIVIWLSTGSFKYALLSMVTNAIPLLFVGGLMGIFHIPLKVSTSLVFSIVYGIAVDDTIHFLHAYLSYRRNNKLEVREAVHMAVKKIAKPMIFTSLVLFAGFMIFSISAFTSIKMIGLMAGTALIIGLLTDLLLLPVMIKILHYKAVKSAISLSMNYSQ